MIFDAPPLPYKTNELEPFISKEAMEVHYNGHFKSYLEKLNSFTEIKEIPAEEFRIEDVIVASANNRVPDNPWKIPQHTEFNDTFNMAAQVWNHTFYWNCLKPQGGGLPTGMVAELIRINFGTYERFKETWRRRSLGLFGSGWSWVCSKGETLWCIAGDNAAIPFVYGLNPVLTIDMWEHAYYLDYKNDRGAFFDAVFENLINWEFANQNLQT